MTLSAEAGWVELESGSAASRATLMSVLSDLDALLILAVPAFSSGDTSLRDVVLDTAIGTVSCFAAEEGRTSVHGETWLTQTGLRLSGC